MIILTQITQTNAAKLHYFAEKDRLVWFHVVLGFVCVNQRDLRDTFGFICADWLSTLACILPQIAQITQRNAASCIILQRKTGCVVHVVWGFVCVNERDQRDTFGFHLCRLIEYSCVYSPADSADHAEECSKAALFRRERQVDASKIANW